jgi:hypothetical protein
VVWCTLYRYEAPREREDCKMTVVLEPSVRDLESERERLLEGSPFTAEELRARAAAYSLTPEESRLLRRLDEIGYLLGEND